MAGSKEAQCRRCSLRMLVPSKVPMVRCLACNTVTDLSPSMPQRGGSKQQRQVVQQGGSGRPQPQPQPQPKPKPQRQLEAPPSPYGRKRAVLCGVDYRGTDRSLKGCINDVIDMRSFLVHHMDFPFDSILILTEDEPNLRKRPTVPNIRGAMRWLVAGSRPGDSLVFHFAGHGDWKINADGTELDGRDEVLCGLDGEILDDEINQLLVRPLVPGVKLHAIIDACHSATVLDLPFLCTFHRNGSYEWEDHRVSEAYKGTNGGVAFCFSACDDDEETYSIPGKGNKYNGAMTHSFIEAAKMKPSPTYGRLLNLMHSSVHEIKSGFTFEHRSFDYSSITTEPQLSSTQEFNIYSTRFSL